MAEIDIRPTGASNERASYLHPSGQPVGMLGKRISWSAVFAGALVAIVTQLALSLLGLGIGMGTVDPLEEQNPLSGLGTGAVIWWALSMLISLFIGGYVAGRLAGVPRFFDSALHGVLTWCLFTLLTLYLLTTTAGKLINTAGNVLGKTASLAGRGVSAVAPEVGQEVKEQLAAKDINLDNLKQEAELLLRQTGKGDLKPENLKRQAGQAGDQLEGAAGNAAENPQGADQSMGSVIDKLFGQGKDVVEEVDREAAINVVAARTGKSREEAGQVVDNWIATYQKTRTQFQQKKQQAEAKARQVGDQAAQATSKAGIWGFIGLLIAGAAATFGARLATPKDVLVNAPMA